MPNGTGIKSYEDWTAPKFLQGEIEDLDLERIKLEFFQRERDNLKYRQRVRSLTSQVEDLTEQVHAGEGDEDDDDEGEATMPKKQKKDSSKGEGQGPSLNEARLEIALEKGLTISQARRLQGTTREELEADAVVYMEEHGISTEGAGDDEGGSDGGDAGEPPQTPPMKSPRRQGTKSGSERTKDDPDPTSYDPEKFLEQV